MRCLSAPSFTRSLRAGVATALGVVAGLTLSLPAQALRSDRDQPLVVESDGKQAASVDLAKKITRVRGNVVITQGTMQIKADDVEVQEDANGNYTAEARGGPATFRQQRDRTEETIDARASRIEYDGSANRIRFIGNARLRVLRDGAVTDEATAEVIRYEQNTDTVTFEGGATTGPAAAASSSTSSGRARLVFQPRRTTPADAASAPAGGASGSAP